MRWNPILRVGGPSEVREHRLDAALVTPEEWRAAFTHPPGRSLVIYELELAGDRVTFTAERGEDVTQTLDAIDVRIRSANLVLERAAPR
jgi:hypothetical protein